MSLVWFLALVWYVGLSAYSAYSAHSAYSAYPADYRLWSDLGPIKRMFLQQMTTFAKSPHCPAAARRQNSRSRTFSSDHGQSGTETELLLIMCPKHFLRILTFDDKLCWNYVKSTKTFNHFEDLFVNTEELWITFDKISFARAWGSNDECADGTGAKYIYVLNERLGWTLWTEM